MTILWKNRKMLTAAAQLGKQRITFYQTWTLVQWKKWHITYTTTNKYFL